MRRVILCHILSNVVTSAMVLASLTIGVVIIADASLSFVAVGVPAPQPAWGSMLSDGRSMLMVGDWWLTVFPGVGILLVVLATQLLGDWLRIRLEPQLRNLQARETGTWPSCCGAQACRRTTPL